MEAGTDPYPIGTGPTRLINASMARDFARYTVAGARGARPVWMVIQASNGLLAI